MSSQESEYIKQKSSIEKAQIQKLDSDQIYRAQEVLSEQHPLSQIKLVQAVPELRYLLNCRCKKNNLSRHSTQTSENLLDDQALLTQSTKTNGKGSSKKSARKSYLEYIKNKLRLGADTTKNSKDFDDPFINYGYGVVAFFQLLKTLIVLFFFLTLLQLPVIMSYYNMGDAIKEYYGPVQTTLGNLGGSYTNCFQSPLVFDRLYLSCNKGFQIAEVSAIGIQTEIYDTLGIKVPRFCNFKSGALDVCSSVYTQELKEKFVSSCVGKQNCDVIGIKNLLKYDEQKALCFTDKVSFFVQVKCYQDEEKLSQYKILGLVVSCIGIFTCAIYFLVVDYNYRLNELNSIIWDLQTVTVNDYTVDLRMNQKVMQEYENYSSQNPLLNQQPVHHLTEFLKTFIRKQIVDYCTENIVDEEILKNKIDIVMIEYDFVQGEFLRLLQKRGQHIKDLKFEKKRDVEVLINRYLIENKRNFQIPIRCFVTFEYTEGLNLFIKLVQEQDKKGKRYQENIIAGIAPIPVDIIWEERNQSRKEVMVKRVYSTIFICILLLGAMIGQFIIRQHGSKATSLYRVSNCRQIWHQYGSDLNHFALEAYGQSERFFEDVFDIEDIDQLHLDLVACYCIKADKNFAFSSLRDRFNITIHEEQQLPPESEQMCKTVRTNYLTAKAIDFAGGETIVAVNWVLRVLIIYLVKFLGYDTQTKYTAVVLKAVLAVQFINTNLIIIFMNADLTQLGIPMINIFSQGYFPDFTYEWYKTIGKLLISTMTFNMYWPILEFIGYFFMRAFFRILDRGLCDCSVWKTRKVTISQYVELYSGPEYLIHYKYASIVNIVFITFMFGAGMPILFPIALTSFITLYLMERLLVAYSYQRPPMFDKEINKLAIRLLKWAPLLYCSVGFWMLNNIQMFNNQVGLKTTFDDNIQTDHTLKSAFRLDHSTPLLIFFFVFFLLIILRQAGKKLFRKLIIDPSYLIFKTEQVSFYEALNEYQRKWLVTEENKAREKFGIQRLSDETLLKLEISPFSQDTELIGVMTYQILDNPIYQKHFQYVPEILENRDKYIVDDYVFNQLGQSDYVKKNLSIFYLNNQKQ